MKVSFLLPKNEINRYVELFRVAPVDGLWVWPKDNEENEKHIEIWVYYNNEKDPEENDFIHFCTITIENERDEELRKELASDSNVSFWCAINRLANILAEVLDAPYIAKLPARYSFGFSISEITRRAKGFGYTKSEAIKDFLSKIDPNDSWIKNIDVFSAADIRRNRLAALEKMWYKEFPEGKQYISVPGNESDDGWRVENCFIIREFSDYCRANNIDPETGRKLDSEGNPILDDRQDLLN